MNTFTVTNPYAVLRAVEIVESIQTLPCPPGSSGEALGSSGAASRNSAAASGSSEEASRSSSDRLDGYACHVMMKKDKVMKGLLTFLITHATTEPASDLEWVARLAQHLYSNIICSIQDQGKAVNIEFVPGENE